MMTDYLSEGIKKRLVFISEDGKQITYLHQKKKRSFLNPEEIVQATTFIKLVIDYGYNAERIRLYETVTMGSEKKEADIIVYKDDDFEEPHILVECKKEEVSEQEFLQAIEQAYSYAYALPNEVKYVWVTSGIRNEYLEVNKKKKSRDTLSDIPQYGVKKIETPYRFVYEAGEVQFEQGKQKLEDLKIVEEIVLTQRFKQAHDALWAGGQLNPSEAFDELDKLIFCKIWDERKYRKVGEPYDFQIITVQKEDVKGYARLSNEELRRAMRELENKRLLERVQALYEEGRRKDPEVFRDNIRLAAEKIRTVVGYLQDLNLGETDLDAKGRAFETFMDSFFRGNFGQYFTPRPIVKFTVDVLPIENDSNVLDTSCGSGGFLLYALNKVREQATALYPTPRTNKQHDNWKKYWHNFAEKNLYGIEINEQISRVAKMNMIIHDDGHTNVITSDGLLPSDELEKVTKNTGFKYNKFNFIITNPPFGSSVKNSEKNYLGQYDFGKKAPDWLDVKGKTHIERRENQSTEILFIEQCHNFLAEGGYLAIVLPDGILTNSSLQYVRDGIEDKYRIVAVVSMPQTAFTAKGAGVKSSVLFLKKHTAKQTEKLRNQKAAIQLKLKEEYKYYDHLAQWEKEKNQKIKDLSGFNNPFPAMGMAELKKTAEYKEWKEEINSYFSDLINGLKEQLNDAYLLAKQTQLPDYPIFMAIAEDIGYDATGKSTGKGDGDLDVIREELKKFISTIDSKK